MLYVMQLMTLVLYCFDSEPERNLDIDVCTVTKHLLQARFTEHFKIILRHCLHLLHVCDEIRKFLMLNVTNCTISGRLYLLTTA